MPPSVLPVEDGHEDRLHAWLRRQPSPDLDGPQCSATVLGGRRDRIGPVGWTPDDRSPSHRDDSILWKASRLDALEWLGEGTPPNSHVGLLGSGLSQAPTAQRPIP